MTDPLADYEARLAEAERRAEQVRDGLERVRVTERTDDGQIAVTVNASGNVVDLTLGSREKSGPELAEDILGTIRAAQAKLADAAREVLSPTLEGSAVLAELDHQYRTTYPEPAPASAQTGRRTLRLGAEDDRATAATEPAARQARPPRQDGDTDYGDRTLLR